MRRQLQTFLENLVKSQDQKKLEAFFSALPFAYCGFSAEGDVSWSPEFTSLLGIETIRSIQDIEAVLNPSDAASLDSMFENLKQNGEAFSLTVDFENDLKSFQIYGQKGESLEQDQAYYVLWLNDVSKQRRDIKDVEAQLEEKGQDYNRMIVALNSLKTPAWIRNSFHRIVWCNKSYADIFSKTPEEVTTDHDELTVTALKKDKKSVQRLNLEDMAKTAYNTDEPQLERGRVIISGKRHIMDFYEMPAPDIKGTFGYAVDISEQETIEAHLSRQIAANKELMEQLNASIAVFAADHTLEFFNTAFSTLWSLEESWLNKRPKLGDLLEKLREKRLLPEQADFGLYKKEWLNQFTTLLEPQITMLYLPDGRAVRMLSIPHPMGGLMMTFEDVTSRLELESSYNTLIAVQSETLDNLAEGVAVFGGDGRLRLWNPSFATLWQFTEDDLIEGMHISDLVLLKKKLFDKDDWPVIKGRLINYAIDRAERKETLSVAADLELECSTKPLPDGGMMVTFRDISDTIRVEKALREKNTALHDAERLKTDFLANVSYQLRTPLNAIVGFTEILQNEFFGKLNERQHEYTNGIKEAGDKLAMLIDNILDLTSIEAGTMAVHSEPVDVHNLMTSVYDLIRDWAAKEKLMTHIKCDKNVGFVVGDEQRLKQAVINVVRNAISYTVAGGDITLAATAISGTDTIEITITDTGVGIPESDIERVFDPFTKSSAVREKTHDHGGPGLGLSLVKNIVDLHGGTVELTSGDNGTKVTISLPIATDAKKSQPEEKRAAG